jgi:Fe-S oxidoreductase
MGIFSFTDKSLLYFPGCFSLAFLKDKVENYRRILKKLNINPRFIEDIGCCGGIILEAGYEKNLRKLAKEHQAYFKNEKIKKIITNCPLCFTTFLKDYKGLLPEWDIKVEFILEAVLEKIKENARVVKNIFMEEIAYYDSCHLGRYTRLHQEPRELLKTLGYGLKEIGYDKEETFCCGSCGNFPKINPEISKNIANEFFKILKRKNVKKIVIADPQAYHHLRECATQLGIKEIEIIEISDLICKALGLKIEEKLE